MSKELKDLIESIDSANRAHSDLERMIRYLKEEVLRLTFIINEQKQIIQNQRAKISDIEENDLPADIVTLKEMISNQRQDLIKKDKDIEILEQMLQDITKELENAKKFGEESEEIIYSNKVIVQLTEENEQKDALIKDLEEKLDKFQEKIDYMQHFDLDDTTQKLIDAKKIIIQLTEENGLNRVKIESLKAEIQEIKSKLEEVESLKGELDEDLNNLSRSNENLINENKEYQEKINLLQQKLEIETYTNQNDLSSNIKIDVIELKERISDLEKENENLLNALNANTILSDNLKQRNDELESVLNQKKNLEIGKESEYRKNMIQKEEELELLTIKLEKIENANKQLNEMLIKLKEQEQKVTSNYRMKLGPENSDLGELKPSLFLNMFNLLDINSQEQITNLLIVHLNEPQRGKRTTAIKLLSMIRGPKVFEAFKRLIKDDDWIVKLYLIKALIKFDNLEVKELLNELKKDKDVDVRETAEKVFNEFNF